MIRYSLKCQDDHVFDSWFQSSAAFDKLADANMVSCPNCGSTKISKALMAPDVKTARAQEKPGISHAMAAPASAAEEALKKLRRQIQDNSEYVGGEFAKEARAIHLGDAPERSIYGEASREDAEKLVEDGVPVAPLPVIPPRKTN